MQKTGAFDSWDEAQATAGPVLEAWVALLQGPARGGAAGGQQARPQTQWQRQHVWLACKTLVGVVQVWRPWTRPHRALQLSL